MNLVELDAEADTTIAEYFDLIDEVVVQFHPLISTDLVSLLVLDYLKEFVNISVEYVNDKFITRKFNGNNHIISEIMKFNVIALEDIGILQRSQELGLLFMYETFNRCSPTCTIENIR